jgi:hypothetical protein
MGDVDFDRDPYSQDSMSVPFCLHGDGKIHITNVERNELAAGIVRRDRMVAHSRPRTAESLQEGNDLLCRNGHKPVVRSAALIHDCL